MGTLGTETEAKPDHREHGEGGEWKKRNRVLANCSNEQKLDSKTNTTKYLNYCEEKVQAAKEKQEANGATKTKKQNKTSSTMTDIDENHSFS